MTPEVVLLTTSEVAERLRVEPATVRRWATDGSLPVVRLPSGTYRFRQSDIDAILAAQTVPGAA